MLALPNQDLNTDCASYPPVSLVLGFTYCTFAYLSSFLHNS
ncbi:putative membrane protein [Microcystis aeruginosa TAIHU98]|uniref:Putative membrane protein n=1 Tax=Microcystis aeruginosa TAIHU98 TaxID=1134457 RepID=L7ECW4_MICAE|nr:putative membrane protein [Microcystis aeruginosa TAIHU98]